MAADDSQMRIEMREVALRTASRELHWANLTIQKKDAEIQLLQERLRKQRLGFLGPSSETLSDLQLELLAEEEQAQRARKWKQNRGASRFPRRCHANRNRIRAASLCRRVCRASKK